MSEGQNLFLQFLDYTVYSAREGQSVLYNLLQIFTLLVNKHCNYLDFHENLIHQYYNNYMVMLIIKSDWCLKVGYKVPRMPI